METELLKHDDIEVSNPDSQPVDQGEAVNLKRCPFCAESIQALAIKCRYCGEFLDGSGQQRTKARPKKWYFATGTVVMALLCLGPLALPLVWVHPRYKPVTKVAITVFVLGLSIACSYLLQHLYQQFLEQFRTLGI
jgi:hypothetical protein